MAEQGEIVTLGEEPDEKTKVGDEKIGDNTVVMVGDDREGKIKQAAEEEADDKEEKTDERVGHGESEETAEERRERNRQERREKKKRRQEYRERDALEMRYLRQRNEELERTVGQINSRVTLTEAAAIDGRIESLKSQIAQANDVMGKATAAQDANTYSEALAIKDDLQKSLARLEAAKTERLAEARRPAPQRAPRIDPDVQNFGAIFMREHPWYDPAGRDEDSAIAQVIDQRLVAEGFRPNTKEFWDELRSRLKKRLPDRFKTEANEPDDDDDDDEDDEPARPSAPEAPVKPVKRDAPSFPSVGNGKPLKAGQVYVSAERKAAMIEAGVWEDKALRERMLRRYQKYDQDNARNRK